MPEFAYTARTARGQDTSGVISAGSRREALSLLADQSLFPLQLEAKDNPAGAKRRFAFRRGVKTDILADAFTQLSDLLTNGVPVLDALRILSQQTAEPRLAEVLSDVRDQVTEGTGLDQAMAAHPDIFNDLTVNMVRAGLEGAFLEEALERTATFLNKQEALRMKVVGSMTYPAILAVVGVSVTVFLVTVIVPMFQGFFDRLARTGSGLPLITVLLIMTSNFLVRYGLFAGGGIAGIVVLARRWMTTDSGREFADRWKLKLPIVGQIFHDAAVSRFCRVLGTLLRNGVPMLTSLRISSASAGNRLLAGAILESVSTISAGESLSRPLAASGLIPAPVMAMISIAEESNTLEQVLVRIADRMDQKIERKLDVMVRLIEPVMLLTIGSMVLFIIMGILLPVFDLNAAID
jgi:type II secretory pathway component PulF